VCPTILYWDIGLSLPEEKHYAKSEAEKEFSEK
jgi:hypothetical protein